MSKRSPFDVLAKGAKTQNWWSLLIDYRTALLKLSHETLGCVVRRSGRGIGFDREEVDRLCDVSPAWLAEMVRFAFATGWRQGKLFALRRGWVDREESEIPSRTARTTRVGASRWSARSSRSWSGCASRAA